MTLHRYLYCNDDPLNRTDPSGQFWGVIDRAGRVAHGVSGYYTGLDEGLKAAGGSWEGVLDVAIAASAFREAYFDPANLNKPFACELALQQGLDDTINKIRNACDWGGLAGCMAEHLAWSAAEIGVQIALAKPAIAICAACLIDPEPISKTVSCGICVGYVRWNVVSAWRTGWGAGKCIVDNCTSWE